MNRWNGRLITTRICQVCYSLFASTYYLFNLALKCKLPTERSEHNTVVTTFSNLTFGGAIMGALKHLQRVPVSSEGKTRSTNPGLQFEHFLIAPAGEELTLTFSSFFLIALYFYGRHSTGKRTEGSINKKKMELNNDDEDFSPLSSVLVHFFPLLLFVACSTASECLSGTERNIHIWPSNSSH